MLPSAPCQLASVLPESISTVPTQRVDAAVSVLQLACALTDCIGALSKQEVGEALIAKSSQGVPCLTEPGFGAAGQAALHGPDWFMWLSSLLYYPEAAGRCLCSVDKVPLLCAGRGNPWRIRQVPQ